MKGALQPAYWGSLVSLVALFVLAIVDYLAGKGGDEGALAYVVSTGFYCLMIAVRYYIAVSISIYSARDKTVFDLPYPLNAVTFCLLAFLILACNLMMAAFGIFGPEPVLLQVQWVVFVSIFISFILWSGSRFRRKQIAAPPLLFVLVDIVILISVLAYRPVSQFVDFEKNGEAQMLIGMIIGVLAFGLLQEAWKAFGQPINEQLSELTAQFLRTK